MVSARSSLDAASTSQGALLSLVHAVSSLSSLDGLMASRTSCEPELTARSYARDPKVLYWKPLAPALTSFSHTEAWRASPRAARCSAVSARGLASCTHTPAASSLDTSRSCPSRAAPRSIAPPPPLPNGTASLVVSVSSLETRTVYRVYGLNFLLKLFSRSEMSPPREGEVGPSSMLSVAASSAVLTSRTSLTVPSSQVSSSRQPSTREPLASGALRTSCARSSSRTSPSIEGSSSTAIATMVATHGLASSSETRRISTALRLDSLSVFSSICIRSIRSRTRSFSLISARIRERRFSPGCLDSCPALVRLGGWSRLPSPSVLSLRGKQPAATISCSTCSTRVTSSLVSFGWSASLSPTDCSESCNERMAISSSPSRAHSLAASNRCSASCAGVTLSRMPSPSTSSLLRASSHVLSELSR